MKSEVKMIAENLKTLRKLNKYSQQEVADKIGISRSTYAGYERQTPPDAIVLMKLSRLYNVSVDFILFGFKKMEYILPLEFKEIIVNLKFEQKNLFWFHLLEYAKYLSKK